MVNGQLDKTTAIVTCKFDIGHRTFVEWFVVIRSLTGHFIDLNFMRQNSSVKRTSDCHVFFPHLIIHVKGTNNRIHSKPPIRAQWVQREISSDNRKGSQIFHWPLLKLGENRYSDTPWQFKWTSTFVDFLLNVNPICQKFRSETDENTQVNLPG